MKHIDAEKLIAEIERLKERAQAERVLHPKTILAAKDYLLIQDYDKLLSFIASLQHEQPDKYETALEKAREWMPNVNQGGHAILIDIFPELGEGLDPRYGGRKQEQPEVNFEKELDRIWFDNKLGNYFDNDALDYAHIKTLCKHFYELGLNARKV